MIKASPITKILTSFIFIAFVSAGRGKKNTFSRTQADEVKVQDKQLQTIQPVNDEHKLNRSEIQPSQTKVDQGNDRGVVNNRRKSVTNRVDTGFDQFANDGPMEIERNVDDDIHRIVKFDEKVKNSMEEEILLPELLQGDVATNPNNKNKNSSRKPESIIQEKSAIDLVDPNQTNKRMTRADIAKAAINSAKDDKKEINANLISLDQQVHDDNANEQFNKPNRNDNSNTSNQNAKGRVEDGLDQFNNQPDQKDQKSVIGLTKKIAKQKTITPSTKRKDIKKQNDDQLNQNVPLESDKKPKHKNTKQNNLQKQQQQQQQQQNINIQKSLFLKPDQVAIPTTDENGFASVSSDISFFGRTDLKPMRILYDETFLKLSLKRMNKMEYLDKIKALVRRMDVYIDNFVKNRIIDVPLITVTQDFDKCETKENTTGFQVEKKYFKQSYSVYAEFIVYLYAFDDSKNSISAAAKVCSFHDKTLNPAIATMGFNLARLFQPKYQSEIGQTVILDIMVHELLHIFAFDRNRTSYLQKLLEKYGGYFPNLSKLITSKNPLFDNAGSHWAFNILTNDLMTSHAAHNLVISVFTMEIIELLNNRVITRKDLLRNNSVLDQITDFDHYLQYTCNDNDEVLEYSNFCTKKQVDEKRRICDDYFLEAFFCIDEKLSNNCYKKASHISLSCLQEDNAAHGAPYETFGDNSRCFMSKGGAKCLATSIRNERVFISGSFGEKECEYSGQVIFITFKLRVGSESTMESQITCPDLPKFIKAYKKTHCKRNCYGNGVCKDGVCHCLKGFDPNTHCKDSIQKQKYTSFDSIPYSVE